MGQPLLEDDMLLMYHLRPMSKREAAQFLFPGAIVTVLISLQQLIQILAFIVDDPKKFGLLLLQALSQLVLAPFGISLSISHSRTPYPTGAVLCYMLIVAISAYRSKREFRHVLQWLRSLHPGAVLAQSTAGNPPFTPSVPPWLSVVDARYIRASELRHQRQEQADSSAASQEEEQRIVNSALVIFHPTEAEAQGQAVTPSTAETSVPETATSPPSIVYPDRASSSLDILPTNHRDSAAVVSAPDESEVATAQEEIQVKVSLLLEIGQDIEVSVLADCLLASGERLPVRVEVTLSKLFQAIIVYLALEARKSGVPHKILKKKIFGDDESKKTQNAFNQSMGRLRDTLQDALERAIEQIHIHFQGKPVKFVVHIHDVILEEVRRPIKLNNKGIFFQQKKVGNDSSLWSLSPLWRVRCFAHLEHLFRMVRVDQSAPEDKKIALELLRESLNQARREYWGDAHVQDQNEQTSVGGFLVNLLIDKAFESWGPGRYEMVRRRYYDALKYVAKREYDHGLRKPEERALFWRNAAELDLERVLVSSSPPVDDGLGQRALHTCIKRFHDLNDDEMAERAYRIYAKRMQKIDAAWEPAPEIVKLLQKIDLQEEE